MADPNQTPERGDWACPCNGCQKAVAWERKQLIQILDQIKHHEYDEKPYDVMIDLIKSRMPKQKTRS